MLPSLPVRWFEDTGIRRTVQQEARAKRKGESDVLVGVHPVLVQLALYRHLAVKDLVERYRVELAAVKAQGLPLPHHFTHTIVIPAVNRDARSVAEVPISGPTATLSLTIWDRVSWVEAHQEQVSHRTRERARYRMDSYAAGANTFYLECRNPPRDLFWFGDIVAAGVLGKVARHSPRRQAAVRLGEPQWFHVMPVGVLNPATSDAHWLDRHRGAGQVLLDLESLYRGVLYATAIGVYALTSAVRATELLQLSDTRWDRIDVPTMRDGKPTGRVDSVLIQWVLPKGTCIDQERQPKLISPQLQPVLKEIIDLLEQAHGGMIPTVRPTYNTKADHLRPEPYLFQWNASADGSCGILTPPDSGKLLRFLYYGVEVTTLMTGEPIRVGVHLCRHVLAKSAHHDGNVPQEVLAFLLTHRGGAPTGSGAGADSCGDRLLRQHPAAVRRGVARLPTRPGWAVRALADGRTDGAGSGPDGCLVARGMGELRDARADRARVVQCGHVPAPPEPGALHRLPMARRGLPYTRIRPAMAQDDRGGDRTLGARGLGHGRTPEAAVAGAARRAYHDDAPSRRSGTSAGALAALPDDAASSRDRSPSGGDRSWPLRERRTGQTNMPTCAHADKRRRETVERLRTAIEVLEARGEQITTGDHQAGRRPRLFGVLPQR